jgi:hypothetical protein
LKPSLAVSVSRIPLPSPCTTGDPVTTVVPETVSGAPPVWNEPAASKAPLVHAAVTDDATEPFVVIEEVTTLEVPPDEQVTANSAFSANLTPCADTSELFCPVNGTPTSFVRFNVVVPLKLLPDT